MKRSPFRTILAKLFPIDKELPPVAVSKSKIAVERVINDREIAEKERRHQEVMAEQQRIKDALSYAQARVQLYLLSTKPNSLGNQYYSRILDTSYRSDL